MVSVLERSRRIGGIPPAGGVALMLSALLLVVVVSTPAWGSEPHLLGTMPAQDGEVERPPGQARVVFDTVVDPDAVVVRVENETGERVDGDDTEVGASPSTIEVSLPADLPAGDYTATWRAEFDGGAELEGSWRFHVLEDPEPDDASSGGRVMVILVALVLLVGAAVTAWIARSRLS